jgi:hypothetical protein
MNETLAEQLAYIFDYEVKSGSGTPGVLSGCARGTLWLLRELARERAGAQTSEDTHAPGASPPGEAPASSTASGGEPSPVAIVCSTKNQYDAIEPVLPRLGSFLLVTRGGAPAGDVLVKRSRVIFRSLLHVPSTLLRALGSSGRRRARYAQFFHRFLLAYGYSHEYRRLLEELGPKVVVLLNDHSVGERAARYAAWSLGIPTLYLQHASVTAQFPPLAFDVACLEGQDAAEKYAAAGPSTTRVLLTGSPKADSLIRLRTRDRGSVRAVGVCPSLRDGLEDVLAWVAALRAQLPEWEIVLRLHPRDERPWRESLDPAMGLSSGRDEPVADFLARVGSVVCGPSSILLEAALAGVQPVSVDFSGSPLADRYGFVAGGLAPQFSRPEECAEYLRTERAGDGDIALLQRYDATIGTEYEGRSAELVAQAILDLAEQGRGGAA